MVIPANSKRIPVLHPDLYKRNPLWFKGAIAYRLLRIMTPKPLTRRLPGILRRPLLQLGFAFPPGWVLGDILPPGLYLPVGVDFPPGWKPGDPLPDGAIIDTTMLFPDWWIPGDPVPDFVIVPLAAYFPPGWTTGDPLPDDLTLLTDVVFPDRWMPGDSPPPDIFIPPETKWPRTWLPGDQIPTGIIQGGGSTMPKRWIPGDTLPGGTDIDTDKYFPPDFTPSDPVPKGAIEPTRSYSNMPDIDSPIPPTYNNPPAPPGPVINSRTSPIYAPLGFWEKWIPDSLCESHDWNLNIGVCGGSGLCIPIPKSNSVGDATAWLRIVGTDYPQSTYIYSGIQSMPTGTLMLQELWWVASIGDPGPPVDHFIVRDDEWASTSWTTPPFATDITQNAVCISITDSADNVCNLYFANDLDWNGALFIPPDYYVGNVVGFRVVANYDLVNDYGLSADETIKKVRLWNTTPASSPGSALANGPRWMDFGPRNDNDWPG